MSLQTRPLARPEVIYPESDGQPMAENTLQWEWIVTIKGGLEVVFRDDPDVFVAGDLLWYPVEGDPTTRVAPDALVAFGRPKGHRGSYKQWEEGGVPPQVVFEVLSPGNRFGEMLKKFRFYERFGVEEYYIYDPDHLTLEGWLRSGATLNPIAEMQRWVSPRLRVRFEMGEGGLTIYGPDDLPFATYDELARQRDELARERNELVQQRDIERRRAERMEARLRELGIDPEA
jgi:Uma2 family endonuclease